MSTLLDGEHLCEFDELPLDERKSFGLRSRRNPGTKLAELYRRKTVELGPIVETEAYRFILMTKQDVLRHGHIGQERLFLEDHSYAGIIGGGNAVQRYFPFANRDASAVNPIESSDRFEQRRLSGTVFSDKADHLVCTNFD